MNILNLHTIEWTPLLLLFSFTIVITGFFYFRSFFGLFPTSSSICLLLLCENISVAIQIFHSNYEFIRHSKSFAYRVQSKYTYFIAHEMIIQPTQIRILFSFFSSSPSSCSLFSFFFMVEVALKSLYMKLGTSHERNTSFCNLSVRCGIVDIHKVFRLFEIIPLA